MENDYIIGGVVGYGKILEKCDYCGHYLTNGKCPRCILKCPYCDKNIGEYSAAGFYPGMCPHMICFFSFEYDTVLWRSRRYRMKYHYFTKIISAGISYAINNGNYVFPFDSEHFRITYFAQAVGMRMVEHKNPFNESPRSSMYLFIKKNP
jgi:hypothetical protein